MPLPPIPDVQPYAHRKAKKKNKEGNPVDQLRIKINSGEFQEKEMYIRPAMIMISQPLADLPMPVRTDTISPAVPNA